MPCSFDTVLGSGIFPQAARFNHSCRGHNNISFVLPTTRTATTTTTTTETTSSLDSEHMKKKEKGEEKKDNDKIVLTVTKPGGVRVGDELTISYGHLPETLSENWGFECRCAGCRVVAAATAAAAEGGKKRRRKWRRKGRRKGSKFIRASNSNNSTTTTTTSMSNKSEVESSSTDSTSSSNNEATTSTSTSTSSTISAHIKDRQFISHDEAKPSRTDHDNHHHRSDDERKTHGKGDSANTICDAKHQQQRGEWKTFVPRRPARYKAGYISQW